MSLAIKLRLHREVKFIHIAFVLKVHGKTRRSRRPALRKRQSQGCISRCSELTANSYGNRKWSSRIGSDQLGGILELDRQRRSDRQLMLSLSRNGIDKFR